VSVELDFSSRLERLLSKAAEKGLEGVVIVGSSNIFYFSGTDAAYALVAGREGTILVSPRLEVLRALEESRIKAEVLGFYEGEVDVAPDENLVKGGVEKAIKEALARAGLKPEKAGGNLKSLSQSSYEKITKEIGELEDISKEVTSLRAVKDADEIEAMREAARIAEKALQTAIEKLEEGVKECEIAGIIEYTIRSSGATDSFPPIVAFGDHSAHPHAKPGLRELKRGDLVKIDLGAKYNGYCSDITRTLVFGGPSDKQQKIIKAVLKAQEEAIASIKPGIDAKDVDSVARRVLKEAGLSPYFNHGLGHGVGIDVHESPYVSPSSKDKLEVGNVFTVEPGVYIRGFGGVRIEDVVLVTEGGAEYITKFERLL